jgi:hypothetical protein
VERQRNFYGYKFHIYDVEAVKNKTFGDDILVYSFDATAFSSPRLMMNESKIFWLGGSEMNIYNFSSLDCFRNAANSVILSLPWRGVWRSKGVDEEPLEPARHIEVYKEVLKYFHQLSMNCRTAILTRSIDDVDLATFTLGDDFIGYRQNKPKMFIYDQNMYQTNRKMFYKTLQISQTTYVSVMGKTIQLVDSTTGQVHNEVKLETNVSDWHFNCNMLVCVHKIADHEHLLSVWRIDNSSNVSNINDVAIGDYDSLLQVDEMFIALQSCSDENAGTKTYIFISMKTFQVERSLSFRAKSFSYDKGYLFLQNKNLIRILDVSSGKFLRDIRTRPHQLGSIICSANSNYVALIPCNNYYSKLHVYDLKCLKQTDAVPSHLLLTTIDLKRISIYLKVKKVVMNETRIVCLNDLTMYVLDLQHIDRLRCPEYNE